MKYTEGWKLIRFAASPELYELLMEKKGKRRWWQFFQDEYKHKPIVRNLEEEAYDVIDRELDEYE